MIASLETKTARLSIISIKSPSNKIDRTYYRDIQIYKAELKQALKLKKKDNVNICKKELQKLRKLLRESKKIQTYTFDVFIKKYKRNAVVRVDLENRDRKKLIKAAIDEAIRYIRTTMKNENAPGPMLVGKKWTAIKQGNEESGFVFTQESSILKIHVKKNMQMLLDGKVPVEPRRYVGIELEFCAPIKEEKLALKLFQNGIHKFAQLKQDGSLRPVPGEQSFELAVLLEERNYKKGLKQVTDLLKDVKAVAKDRRCGLHVHIDMRRRDKDLVYNNMVACQYALLSVVDPNRYNNEFCRVVNSRKFPTEFTGDRVERYKTINAAAYYKFRTLEIRMHEGSISFTEISHWVDLLLKVANYSKYLKNDVTKIPVLKTRLQLKKKLYDYAIERSCSWQVQNNPNARNMREDMAELGVRPGGLRNRLNEILGQQEVRLQPLRFDEPVFNAADIAQGIHDAPINGIFHIDNINMANIGQQIVAGPEQGVDFDDELMEDGNED